MEIFLSKPILSEPTITKRQCLDNAVSMLPNPFCREVTFPGPTSVAP
jgi:hypothetical protein